MFENSHSNLQAMFGVHITSNIFKIIQFKNHGIAPTNPPTSQLWKLTLPPVYSGVARAFPGGRPAHPEPQIEEENGENLRKDERKSRRMRKNWGNVAFLPTRGWESDYGPVGVGGRFEFFFAKMKGKDELEGTRNNFTPWLRDFEHQGENCLGVQPLFGELGFSSHWQNIKFLRNCSKFHKFTKIDF